MIHRAAQNPVNQKKIEELFRIQKSSPQEGTIKIVLAPDANVSVGESFEIKAALSKPDGDFDQIFLVKIADPEQPKEKAPKNEQEEDEKIGLPNLVLVYSEAVEGREGKTWNDLELNGISMDYETVVHPYAEDDILQAIYVNMDSHVLKDYKSTLKTADQLEAAEKRYYTSVYFHTLFLFTISKNKKYSIKQGDGDAAKDIDLVEYVKDIFESYYAQFLLNFGMSELVQSLEN